MPKLIRLMTLFACIGLVWFAAFGQNEDLIEDIEVRGNRRMATDSILYRISSKQGSQLDPERVTGDLRALWETGLFENVGAALEQGESGKRLVFIVRELPLIVETDIRGNKRLTKSSITDKIEEEKLTIPEDTPLDYGKINAIRTLIKKLMDDKGLRFGTVEYKLEYLDAGTARVVFNIDEGTKVKIDKIEFDGNDLYSDRKLRRTMKKTKERNWITWLTQQDVFTEEKFAEDVEKLQKRYWEKGYKDIYVGEPMLTITDQTSERQQAKNEERAKEGKRIKEDKRLELDIPIFEGQPYVMGTMTVEDNTVLPNVYYERTFPLENGQVYDLGQINEWITELEEIHNNTGYVNYNVEQKVVVRDVNVVDVNFKVNERDQIYVNRIGFKGNTTTRDKVLRREVLLREGDVFRLNFFRNSLLRINQLGFFDVSRSEPDVRFLPNENKVNIDINGFESGVNELNFGLGYSEYRGSSGFLSFSTLNFMGKGEQLSVQAQLGSITDTFDISFTEPWLFDKPRGVTARVFNTRSSFEASGFDSESTGFQVGLSFRPSTFTTYSIAYTFKEERFPTITSPVFKPVDDLLTSSITQGITYNTTDHPFFPTRGRKLSTSLELASWQFGGDNYFYRLTGSAVQFVPAFKKTFFGLHVKGGYIDSLEGQRPTQNQLFYLGGEESVRGYSRQSLGPVVTDLNGNTIAVRGDKLAQFNAEFVIPVSDQFRFVTFFDMGMIYGVDEEWFDSDFARSAGLEMRFSLPVFQAPLRLIYAYVLDDTGRNNDPGGDVSFSVGTTF